MRSLLFVLVALAGTIQCSADTTDTAPAPVVAAPAGAWVPVATYAFADDATGARIRTVLHARGIESVTVGSLGATVSVASRDAASARELLGADLATTTKPTFAVYE